MHSWHGTEEFVCDLPLLERALKRLHLEKSSPDGLTAELLRSRTFHFELFVSTLSPCGATGMWPVGGQGEVSALGETRH